jgi:hypothetical protein
VTQFSLPAAQSGEQKLVRKTNNKEVKAEVQGEDVNLMGNSILWNRQHRAVKCIGLRKDSVV